MLKKTAPLQLLKRQLHFKKKDHSTSTTSTAIAIKPFKSERLTFYTFGKGILLQMRNNWRMRQYLV